MHAHGRKYPLILEIHGGPFASYGPVFSTDDQLYEALQLRGIPTALVKVPGASHGGLAARPSQSAAKASAILAWFERYRTGTPPGPGAPSTSSPEPVR